MPISSKNLSLFSFFLAIGLLFSGCESNEPMLGEPLRLETHEIVLATFLFDSDGSPDLMIFDVIDPESPGRNGVVSGYQIRISLSLFKDVSSDKAYVKGKPYDLEQRGSTNNSTLAGYVEYTIQANPEAGVDFILTNNRRLVDAIDLKSNGRIPIRSNIDYSSQAIFKIQSRFPLESWTAADFEVTKTTGTIGNL